MANITDFTIAQTATIAEAFRALNHNKAGILFATDESDRVVGAVTDGDIRRQLLTTNDMQVAVSVCMSRDFVRVVAGTSREKILKLLDSRITAVPTLGEAGELVDVVSANTLRLDRERQMFARARAPARISFGGGGTDLTHYFDVNGGVVINATINKFAHATLRRHDDAHVVIVSRDLGVTAEAPCLADLKCNGEMDLIKALVALIEPDFGFELEIASDFPVGSGLGGSSVVAAAVIGCFNVFRTDPWDRHEIAEMSFQVERLILKIAGGWQDQYASVFGGFNLMEFTADHNMITPLRLESRVMRELEESLLLCYTGRSRNSGNIHDDQKVRMQSDEGAQQIAIDQKRITMEIKRHLLRGELSDCGRLLHEAWVSKKKYSPMISSPELDAIYDHAMASGALGGKLLGAGGGGYFLFFAPPFGRHRLQAEMQALGYETDRILFDEAGLQTWKIRMGDE